MLCHADVGGIYNDSQMPARAAPSYVGMTN